MSKEMMEITVPTPYAVGPVHFYTYKSGDAWLLIDAGVNTEEAWILFLDKLKQSGYDLSQLKGILLTHHHIDHIGLVNKITSLKEVPVYIHSNGIPRATRNQEFLDNRLRFFEVLYAEMGCGQIGKEFIDGVRQRMGENNQHRITARLIPISAGDRIESFEDLEIIETHGHAPDHLAFYDRKEGWMFTGDLILQHVSSNAIVEPSLQFKRLPTLRMQQASLMRVRDLDSKVFYPGHGPTIRNPIELIDLRLKRMGQKMQRILNILEHEELTAFEMAVKIYPSEYKPQFSLVMSEIIGHLDVLEDECKIKRHQNKGIWYFSVEK